MPFAVLQVDSGNHYVDPSIARNEELDALDPLRHLMHDELIGIVDDEELLPTQQRSVHNETLRLSFFDKWSSIQKPILINLVVDASPGCGGVAWPAGQVAYDFTSTRSVLIYKYSNNKPLLDSGELSGQTRVAIFER